MSDKKTVKSACKKEAEKEHKMPTIMGPDGKERLLRSGDIIKEVDGKFVTVPKDEVVKNILAAKGMLITVRDNDIGMNTYGLSVKRFSNGNILLSIKTSDKADSGFVIPKDGERAKELYNPDPRGIRVVGRCSEMEAMYAITACYKAYTQSLGISNAYTLVRLELQDIGKGLRWYGLYVPTINVISA